MKRNKKMILKVFEDEKREESTKTTSRAKEPAKLLMSMGSLNYFKLKQLNSFLENDKSKETQHLEVLQDVFLDPHCSPGLGNDDENVPTPTSIIKDSDLALATPEAPIYSPITPIDKHTFMSDNNNKLDKNIMIGDSSENSSPVRSISVSPDNMNMFESLSRSNAFEFGEFSDDSAKDPDYVAEDGSNSSPANDFTHVLTVADVHFDKLNSSSKHPTTQEGQFQRNKNNASSHALINDDCIEVLTEIEMQSPVTLSNSRSMLHNLVSNARKRRASENDLPQTGQPAKKVRRSTSLTGLILPPNKPISPKKKSRSDPSKWKRYIERGKRARGESYKTLSGKVVAARPTKEPRCLAKPKHKCNENVPESARKSIYESFRSLQTLDDQRRFIVQHVQRDKKKRSTTDGPSRKECTNHYSFTVFGNIQVQVCREFFLDTLNITEGMIRGALKKISSEGVLERDNRGRKSPPNKLSADRLNDIKSHIFSFPTMESHYCRSSTEYKYLEASLNIQAMHTLYKKQCIEKDIVPACLETYRKNFRSYKLKFHVPKKDICKRCIAFKNNESRFDDHSKHLKRRDDSYLRRDADKEAASNDVTTLAFNFDLEAVLYTPKGAAGPFFYVRKLAVYNLTFYKFGDQDVDCYTWDETEGNRGSIEISTCVYKYIQDKEGVTHVRMMSDNCGGQQKNYTFCCMLLHLVSTHQTIETIDHVFFESGHSHMECDSIHSKIEQKAKHLPIYTPDGWIQVMRSARMNPRPFKVNVLAHDEFLNFNTNEVKFAKEAPKRQRRKKKNKNNATEENRSQDDKLKTNFNDAVWIQYRKNNPMSIFIKTEYNDREFTELQIKFKKGKDAAILPVTAYETRIPISKAKKRDLMKLCHDNQIPRYYHSYYDSLPDSEEVIDRLAEPDIDEC